MNNAKINIDQEYQNMILTRPKLKNFPRNVSIIDKQFDLYSKPIVPLITTIGTKSYYNSKEKKLTKETGVQTKMWPPRKRIRRIFNEKAVS